MDLNVKSKKGGRAGPIGKQIFSNDRPPLGLFVWEFPSPGMWPILASTGLDFAVVDMEHSAFSYRDVGNLLSGAKSTELVALVRVPELNKNAIGRVLDLGADGVIVPHISSSEEAAKLVSYAKYHPLGKRNVAFGCPLDGYGNTTLGVEEVSHFANENSLCIPMIESLEGVSVAREICETPGIDAIWLGFADLSQSVGKLGDYELSSFVEAENRVLSVCSKSNTTVGVVATSINDAVYQARRGYGMIALGTEVSIIQQEVANRVQEIAARLPCT